MQEYIYRVEQIRLSDKQLLSNMLHQTARGSSFGIHGIHFNVLAGLLFRLVCERYEHGGVLF